MTAITLIGIPLHEGSRQFGTIMGPDGLRAAGLATALGDLGHEVADEGNLPPPTSTSRPVENAQTSEGSAVRNGDVVCAWMRAIQQKTETLGPDQLPIFFGGDHALSLGTLPAMAARAEAAGKPFFVLWLDAHPDMHTPQSTTSGNLHGTPLAYATGEPGFAGLFPPLPCQVRQDQVMMMGLRSVDAMERQRLAERAFQLVDMRRLDEEGVVRPLEAFLAQVAARGGDLHVSLDLDFLDPLHAPGVGTPVQGGATLREAHLIMEMLHESQLLTSLDLVELNPYLDHAGMSARLMVDLTAGLFGRRILEAS